MSRTQRVLFFAVFVLVGPAFGETFGRVKFNRDGIAANWNAADDFIVRRVTIEHPDPASYRPDEPLTPSWITFELQRVGSSPLSTLRINAHDVARRGLSLYELERAMRNENSGIVFRVTDDGWRKLPREPVIHIVDFRFVPRCEKVLSGYTGPRPAM